jgi:hypothetical protein
VAQPFHMFVKPRIGVSSDREAAFSSDMLAPWRRPRLCGGAGLLLVVMLDRQSETSHDNRHIGLQYERESLRAAFLSRRKPAMAQWVTPLDDIR